MLSVKSQTQAVHPAPAIHSGSTAPTQGRKRQKDLKRLNVLTSSADNFPSDQSPYLTRAGSTHSSLASTSLVFAMEDSTQSLGSGSSSSSSSDNIFSNLDFFAHETSNVDEDDDEEDNTHPKSATQTVTTLSDVDDSDVDGLWNLTMRKCSDQIEVIIRATAAAVSRQRALNRATVSITATGINSRMPTIPENEIPSNDNLAPLPHLMPTQTTRASWPDEFCLPGFIP